MDLSNVLNTDSPALKVEPVDESLPHSVSDNNETAYTTTTNTVTQSHEAEPQLAESDMPSSTAQLNGAEPDAVMDPSLDVATARAIMEAQNQFGTRVRATKSAAEKAASPTPAPSTTSRPSAPPKKRPAPKRPPGSKKPSKKRKVDDGEGRNTPGSQGRAISPVSDRESEGSIDTDDDEVYCICRKGDNHTFMICCEECGEWYHGKCIKVKQEDEKLMDKFACPMCEEAGRGFTTWLPMCRRTQCGNAARTRGDNGKPLLNPSKYCSDECGVMFMTEKMGQSSLIRTATKRQGRLTKLDSDSIMKDNDDDDFEDDEHDMSSLGGAIRMPELKALVNSVSNAEDFRHLGISGLPTPPASASPEGDDLRLEQFTDLESKRLAEIMTRKGALRDRRTLLKDKERFVQMAKERASKRAQEKETKDQCSFDPRLTWDETTFAAWRESAEGEAAFESGILEPSGDAMEGIEQDGVASNITPELCSKKARGCGRHPQWQKLVLQDVRFEEADVGDEMRKIDREEREIRERALIRMQRRALGLDAADLDNEGAAEIVGYKNS